MVPAPFARQGPRRPGRAWLRDDRGSAELIAFSIIAPVLLLIVLGGLNLALAQHTRELATVAAAEAARAAATAWDVSQAPAIGVQAGNAFLNAVGTATGVNCSANGSGTGTVAVAVAGGVGSDVTATVDWCYMNLFDGLVRMLRGTDIGHLSGTVTMTVRKEGW